MPYRWCADHVLQMEILHKGKPNLCTDPVDRITGLMHALAMILQTTSGSCAIPQFEQVQHCIERADDEKIVRVPLRY